MLEGSLFLFEGFLKEFLWNWRERGVERGLSSQELGNPFFVFVPFVAPPSVPLEQNVIPSLGTSSSSVDLLVSCTSYR